MTAQTILPANTLSSGYDVANSCRFNSGDSAVLKRTHGTPTSAKKFVWSAWIKRSKLGADQYFVQNYTDGSNISMIYFRSGDDIRIFDRHGTGDGTDTVWISNGLFRDISAWYHILLKVDTTQSTDSNRLKVYINGVQDTGNGITYPALNANMNFTSASASNRHSIAATSDGYNYFGGYLCEVVLIDGTSPDHTDFGEFDSDSGIWKPIDVSELTFGNNGYYLDFADSGDLGDDESGNGNDFAETNLAATDQSTDTCTNNFATMNPLDNYYASATFTEGNTTTNITSSSIETYNLSTIGVSSGKWYAECKVETTSKNTHIGIVSESSKSTGDYVGIDASGYGYAGGTVGVGNKWNNGSQTSYADNYTTNDIIGVAMDLDNNKIYFSKNGTWQNSGDPESGATGTGSAFTITASSSTPDGVYYFAGGKRSNDTVKLNWNFGSPSFAISSGNADGNGYGNFEYAVPSGYYALNTKNLAEYG